MLHQLFIRNFALVDELRLEFPSGLNLLTGETGAGKSIVIDALGIVLGERVSASDAVRSGADKCLVEAMFDLSDASPATLDYLNSEQLISEDDPSTLFISRELTRSGKNQCRINGRLMPVSALREATDGLVDIHGQNEHQTLLSSEKHLDLLDNWLGKQALDQKSRVAVLHSEAVSLRKSLNELRESAKERARNLDLYKFQLDEILAANLGEVNETELAADRTRLMNAEKLHTLAEEAYAALSEAAIDGLNSALSSAQKASAVDPEVEQIVTMLSEASVAADEARRALRVYKDNIEFNQARLEEIEEQIDLMRSLKRKYGESVDEIIEFSATLTAKLDMLENSDELEARYARELKAAESKLASEAQLLSQIRRLGSKEFGDAILKELRDLGMAQSRFAVQINDQPVTSKGIDKVEFLISPNPGEPVKPLAKVASGGELSRIMLALKSVLSRAAYVPTLIFDEIDAGVGGRTAVTIAAKLAALASSAQVFCITHLPQIASQSAAAHFFIEKRVEHGRTTVQITALNPEGRVEEITRMLGGTNASATVTQHAREMLEAAIPSSV